MKKFFLLAAAAAVAAFAACTKPENNEPTPGPGPGPETKDAVTVSPASVAFEADGGTFRVAVTTNVDDYSVSGNPDWLTVAKNGKEISLTAAQNTVNETRSASLTVTAGTATASIAVSQKAGSPYAGFTSLSEAHFDYGGTMLYTFMKPTEEDYGGWATLGLSDGEEHGIVLWIYTDLFLSEEEVELTPGTYVKGADDYTNLKLCAKKLTYMAGLIVEDDEEPYTTGSYYVSATTEQEIPLVDGTVEVVRNGKAYTIKVDMTGVDGNAYKFVYEGEVEVDAENATYPGNTDRIDVANTVYGAAAIYYGDNFGNGTSTINLQIYSGDPASPALTQFAFNIAAADYSEDMDLSGEYYTPVEAEEGEEASDPNGPGTIIPGTMVELFPGFSMPMGTYIMYTYEDIVMADAYASLILEKQEDGKYTFSGAIMSQAGDMVMFMGADFTGIHDLEIPIYDGTETGEED
jgi:hypothetical protein